jgi:hypothetical protein
MARRLLRPLICILATIAVVLANLSLAGAHLPRDAMNPWQDHATAADRFDCRDCAAMTAGATPCVQAICVAPGIVAESVFLVPRRSTQVDTIGTSWPAGLNRAPPNPPA